MLGAPHQTFRDYKPSPQARKPQVSRAPWFLAGVGIPLIAVGLINQNSSAEYAPNAAQPLTTANAASLAGPGGTPPLRPATTVNPALALEQADSSAPPVAEQPFTLGQLLTLKVKAGDSLDRLFSRHELDRGDLAEIMSLGLAREHLRLIKPGDEIQLRHEDGKLLSMVREVNMAESLVIAREDEEFTAAMVAQDLERRITTTSGRIQSSLFEAAAEAGVSDRTIMNLAGIFAWDVDFVLDIRQGDEFNIVYEELWRDGERLSEGEILAAEFVNQGEIFRAVRYTTPDDRTDYFTPEGRSVRKAFVRAPLSFSRISSNFNPRRRHPKLNTIRAHQGVDYAAPRGTPVKAAGDGKVIHRGRKGGYGKTVILQHGGNITTLYAHLSNYSRVRHGARVRQGDVIGYVGATGLATGPHLHYEYRANGVHRNPRTVKLPDAEPLNAEYLPEFQAATADLLQKLDGDHRLATTETPDADL